MAKFKRLMGNMLTKLSTTCVDHDANMLPLNILKLASWSTYSVVAARDFFIEGTFRDV